MKATLYNNVIADSDDTVSVRGYDYFPLAAVRTEWLEKAPRTPKDLDVRTACSSTTSCSTASATRAMPGSTSGRSPP